MIESHDQADAEALRSFLAARDAPCPGCGYSLRGLQSAVCPECGIALSVRLFERAGRLPLPAHLHVALVLQILASIGAANPFLRGRDKFGGSCCLAFALLVLTIGWYGLWSVGSARARLHPGEAWKLGVLGFGLWLMFVASASLLVWTIARLSSTLGS